MIQLKTLDIVVVDGLWYMPHHWLIKWRSLAKGVHCATVKNSNGDIWNPIFAGIKDDNISSYTGRNIIIVRYNKPFDAEKVARVCRYNAHHSRGYDFFRQWLFGYVFGFITKAWANDEYRWTCSEFPYWAFQDSGYKLTAIDEQLPLPRLFLYHNDFDIIYQGLWPKGV